VKHKIEYRLRNVPVEKIDKLYIGINSNCKACKHDCKNSVSDSEKCVNREIREDINEIIDMIRGNKLNLITLCEDYNLKLNIILDMLRAKQILSFKYYKCIMLKLNLIEEYDEFEKYKGLFNNDEL
jgi:hypothetical protein